MNNNYVWYLSYGSNLLFDRFKYYIEGGYCPYNNSTYNGCSDKTLPIKSKPYIIEYPMYFAKKQEVGEMVEYVLKNTPIKGHITYCRMHLITIEQFEQVWEQEGKTNWYSKKIELGLYEDYPIYTFTNSIDMDKNPPHESYYNVVRDGLIETFPKLTLSQINKYLKMKNN